MEKKQLETKISKELSGAIKGLWMTESGGVTWAVNILGSMTFKGTESFREKVIPWETQGIHPIS